ncbi:SDR family oxidoreductase [Arthrobacter sp. ISL-30]|uniref:SDR family oxidoreductase n=1 Tax=Arthrobacter sp. ISL-30 TaxID=2819109 RepID=UPI001BEA170B|nr:SDR family NAD(P)-dependent oxidoreductase [Arthrobacter sp. ISL-30]MBT2512153.1 SDR family NAD(P)-dependent oxidoreductase [Arthrobacter sp. ISL-30]
MPGRTKNVVITGGSGASGVAMARAFSEAGFRVFTVGSNEARIKMAASQAGPHVIPIACDLADLEAVRELADSIRRQSGGVDGVMHLVGGWRGANGIQDQSDEDWRFLEESGITTLRNVTRVFFDDLASSPIGRFAMVSSTAVAAPKAAGANYAAAKAAAEAWTLAVADGLATQGETTRVELKSAATIFVVRALVDEGMRGKNPQRTFAGYTDVEELAAAAVGLFDRPAEEVNGRRIILADE